MKKLDNRGSLLTVLLFILLAAAVILLFVFKDDLGFGSGSEGDGNGDKSNVESNVSTEATTEATTETEGSEVKTITIVVKQSKYFIDDKEYSLAEIEGLIKDDKDKTTKFIMEDNYAGAEAWDQLKSLFAGYDISPVKND